METLRKTQMEMPDIITTITEMKISIYQLSFWLGEAWVFTDRMWEELMCATVKEHALYGSH